MICDGIIVPRWWEIFLGLILCKINLYTANAQFFIPNPSGQQDQFQGSSGGLFPDSFVPQNGPPPNGFADTLFSQGFIPQSQQPDISGQQILPELVPTALPKHLIPPADFVCEDTFGHYGDQGNCSRFFVCVFGLPVVQECSKGLFYNPLLGLCDWPKNTECPVKGGGFFAIPGTTTEGPARATIPWWLQGEDGPPTLSSERTQLLQQAQLQEQQQLQQQQQRQQQLHRLNAPTQQQDHPPQQSVFTSQADTSAFERTRANSSAESRPPSPPSQSLSAFPMGPGFSVHQLPTTRRPWWNPWQPSSQNNETWPMGSRTTPRPSRLEVPFPGISSQSDFLSFQNSPSPSKSDDSPPSRPTSTNTADRLDRQQERPDSSLNFNPNSDGGNRDSSMAQDQIPRDQDLFSRESGAFRPGFFGSPFSRPDFGAQPKPSRGGEQTSPSKQGRPNPAFIPATSPDAFPQSVRPSMPDPFLSGRPLASRPDSTDRFSGDSRQTQDQSNDGPVQRPPANLPVFPDFGRAPLRAPFAQDSLPQQPPRFGSSQNQSPFSSISGEINSDRLDISSPKISTSSKSGTSGASTRPDNDRRPTSFTGQGGPSSQSRPDFSSDPLQNRQEQGNRPDDFPVAPNNRPDFANRFLQQDGQAAPGGPSRNTMPFGPLPFPMPPRQGPALSADFPPGFIQSGPQQLTQERLQQIAQERLRHLSRQGPPNEKFHAGFLGFGLDPSRFANDEPAQPGVIRPSERMGSSQNQGMFFDRNGPDAPEFPNLQQRQSLNSFAPPPPDQGAMESVQQFTFSTHVPALLTDDPKETPARGTTSVPFWMQGSSSQNSIMPLNVFRTDIQRTGSTGVIPQTRVLQHVSAENRK